MPEIMVLDTHIWFWWINEEHHRFPASWLARIENAEKVVVSPVSCFEIALAHKRGRLALPCDAGDWVRDALTPAGVELLPLTAAIATRAVSLSPIDIVPTLRRGNAVRTALRFGDARASLPGSHAGAREMPIESLHSSLWFSERRHYSRYK